MNNELLLLSKNDIPFREAQVNIHQPTIKEISLISEESFQIGTRFLNFSINRLSHEDKVNLGDKTDFEIFMSIMNSKEKAKYKVDSLLVLALLFPEYMINIGENEIILANAQGVSRINENNFDIFKDILVSMFCMNEKTTEQDEGSYNPSDGLAAKIVDKFNKRKMILAKEAGTDVTKIAVFSRYVSILSVALQKDMNDLMNYTVFQLKDEFKRFQLKQSFDIYFEAKMAGAKDLDEVDNWMDDIHS